jgi:ketosteroid isomerase-like protein
MSLKHILAACLLSLFLHPVSAADIQVAPAILPVEDIADIRNTILAQLDAFKADDAEAAFSYAAPGIREIFKTPEIFLHMVRKSYQAVYRPKSFEFRDLQRIEGRIVQPVAVTGPTGVAETALYVMEEQPNGSWKIGACIMAREPGSDT